MSLKPEHSEEIIDVAVIGGGMGGLIAGVALQYAGWNVHVFEQAQAYGDVGGHLTIDDAAIAVLSRYGLGEKFRALACPLACMEVRRLATGEMITRYPFPDLGSMGVKDENRMGTRTIYAFLRADFLKIVGDAIEPERIHTGHRLSALEDGEHSATATFDNGEQVTAKIILAADGVKSLARRIFDDSKATAARHTILRTLCSAEILPEGQPNDRMYFWDGWALGDKDNNLGTHVLTVPVRDQKYLSIDLQIHGGDQLEDCNPADIPLDRILPQYPPGSEMDPVIMAMINARLEPITAHALWDRPVAEKWVGQRIAIMGDAAHNMRPTLGQGASQAIHDAGELEQRIGEYGLTHAALKMYEAVRKPYLESIVYIANNTVSDPKAWKDKAN